MINYAFTLLFIQAACKPQSMRRVLEHNLEGLTLEQLTAMRRTGIELKLCNEEDLEPIWSILERR